MAKLLRLRDYVLLTAALAGEVVDELRLVGGLVPSAMRNRYGYVPSKYKRASYLSTVSRMLSTGDIKKLVDHKGRVYLELASTGEKKYKRRFALFLRAKRWDGYFMVVIFDIPEEDSSVRKNLRIKLSELGFGMLQKSVWISPYHFEEDMREFLVQNGLEAQVFVLSAKKLWAGDFKGLAENVWNLKNINRAYKRVLKDMTKASKLKGATRQKTLGEAYTLYFDTLSFDPLLPKEFLPENWARERALAKLNQAFRS